MSSTFVWPQIRGAQIDFNPYVPTRTGGQSVTGIEQVIDGATGFWKASVKIPLRTRDGVLLARALRARMRGRGVPFYLGPADCRNDVAASSGLPRDGDDVEHSDGADFDDGSGYAQPTIAGWFSEAADLRAVSAQITVQTDANINPGQYFGIGQRLYILTEVRPVSAGVYDIGFWPELRAAAAVNDVIEFVKPQTLVRLAADDGADISVDLQRFGSITFDAVEVPA